MASILGALRRVLGLRTAPRISTANASSRQAAFEPLEPRHLLAGNTLATIAGTVYADGDDDGLTPGDVGVQNVAVNLFRDGANGVFDGGAIGGDDILIDSQRTDADGNYLFRDIVPGRYFVQQTDAPGLMMRPGTAVQEIIATDSDMGGVVRSAIDTFQTVQAAVASSLGSRTDESVAAAPEAIGGERDLYLALTSDIGRLELISNPGNETLLEFNSTAAADGVRLVTWDGADGDALNLNPRGLGGYDLTMNDTVDGIQFSLGADHSAGKLVLRVYSDASNWSSATVDITKTGGGSGSAPVVIMLDDFVVGGGSGANFADVGAMQLEIEGNAAIDGQIKRLDTFGSKVLRADFANLTPLSVGNQVWFDANNNGMFDTGVESGIDGVVMNLYADGDGNNVYTPGTDQFLMTETTQAAGRYSFDGLLPGSYVVQVAAANFAAGGPLEGLELTTGKLPTDPDDDVNHDSDGVAMTTQGVMSRAVTLSSGDEPVAEDPSANSNMTVDFGFTLFDLSLTKSDQGGDVRAGEDLTYTLVITNHGPADAADVTVVDPLPAGVTYRNAAVSQGSSQVDSIQRAVTAQLGDLAVGATATVSIVVNVDPGFTGTLFNEASVSGRRDTSVPVVNDPWRETNLANNQDSEQTPVTAQIDLAIDKSDTPDPVVAGNELVYMLLVTNHGPSIASGVVVEDVLPTDLLFKTVSTSQGNAAENAGTVMANLGTLQVGATATVTIVADVASGSEDTLVNVAKVSANEVDIDPSNDVDDEVTLVRSVYDLQVTKTDSPDPIVAGEQLTYTLVVTNNGPSDAMDVIVVDDLPSEVSYISAETTQGVIDFNNGRVTAQLGYLANGDSETVTILVTVDPTAVGEIENVTSVDGKPVQSNPLMLGQFATETNLTNNVDEAPTLIQSALSTISGYVYVDLDDDGVRDTEDPPIPDVEVRLSGVNVLGDSVAETDLTDEEGYYEFLDLYPGSYTVTETQPDAFQDGKDSPGRLASSTVPLTYSVRDDLFVDIGLGGGVDAIEFNFGELMSGVNKRDFLSST